MANAFPFHHEGLSGGISVRLRNGQSLDQFCSKYIPDYNPDRLEAVAIRLYVGKETIVTIYALDKNRREGDNFNPQKLPVKKFKLEKLSSFDLFDAFEEFNFTLSTGNYPIEDMEVVNK
jgi:hypothetical protein